jgi:hypothetical protein
MRYVHISDDDVREAMTKEREEKDGHTLGIPSRSAVPLTKKSPL